jgi:hypothetical protein
LHGKAGEVKPGVDAASLPVLPPVRVGRTALSPGGAMDVHKPKPVANLRELATEIGTIVIGVLIALSAEQAVEALHWAHKIDEAENALRLELQQDDAPQAYARAAITTCLQQSLDKMHALLETHGDRRAFLALARTYRPPSRTWDSESWHATVASDVGTHMGADRIVRWSRPFRIIPSMNEQSNRELVDVDAVRGLPDEAGPLTQEEVERLSVDLEKLETDNAMMGLASTLLLIYSKGVDADVSSAGKRAVLAEARSLYGGCVSPPDYNPLPGGVGQYLTPAQEAQLMQYHGDAASLPGSW